MGEFPLKEGKLCKLFASCFQLDHLVAALQYTIHYRELGQQFTKVLCKLLAGDRCANLLRAEGLKASYLSFNAQPCQSILISPLHTAAVRWPFHL